MNPYEVLGVPKKATAARVGRAYRKLLRKRHPDCGGTPEQFNQLQDAYAVLSDPARRKRYDETGEVHADPAPDRGVEVVVAAFDAALRAAVQSATVAHADLVKDARDAVNSRLRQLREILTEARAGLARLADAAARLQDQSGVLAAHAENCRERVAAEVAALGLEIRSHESALKLLDGASYRTDPAPDRHPPPYGFYPLRAARIITGEIRWE